MFTVGWRLDTGLVLEFLATVMFDWNTYRGALIARSVQGACCTAAACAEVATLQRRRRRLCRCCALHVPTAQVSIMAA